MKLNKTLIFTVCLLSFSFVYAQTNLQDEMDSLFGEGAGDLTTAITSEEYESSASTGGSAEKSDNSAGNTMSVTLETEDSTDNFDDIFGEGAGDVEAVIVEVKKPVTVTVKDVSIPLKFSGKLTSDLGLGYLNIEEDDDDKSGPNGYFDFTNYLYFSAFPNKNFGIRGSVRTLYPLSDSNSTLKLYELYFDYLILDKLYVTAGKKTTTWGYVRLFTTDNNDSSNEINQRNFGFETNILSDSRNGTSVIFRLPVYTGTFTGLSYYTGTSKEPSLSDMNFAGSAEMTFWKTSLHLFGRRFPKSSSKLAPKNNGFKFGFEAKRTFFDADCYFQTIRQLADNVYFARFRETHEIHDYYFGDIVYTYGVYKWWDKFDPNVGFNIEYQDEYLPKDDAHYRRIGFDGGVKRLGPKRNIKIGLEWMHTLEKNDGYVKPGVIVSGVFPNVDWKNGLKFVYEDGTKTKTIFGSYLEFILNY